MENKTQLPNNFKYHKQVGLIYNTYLMAVVMISLMVVLKMLGSEIFSGISFYSLAWSFFLGTCLCYGLNCLKSWVVLPILLQGYAGVFGIFSRFITPYSFPPDLQSSFAMVSFLFAKLFQIILFVLFVSEVVIFSKKETHAYFKTNGIGII